MFKKKVKKIKVIHYDGLRGFNQDYPCSIEVNNEFIEIKTIKPEIVVKLSKSKIIKIDSLTDNEFMQKYNHTNGTNKMKYYLVITYSSDDNTEKNIIFWGTAKEAIEFNKLKYQYNNIQSYTL